MAALLDTIDTTTQRDGKREAGAISSLTVTTWQLETEVDKGLRETSQKPEVSRLGPLASDLTYPEQESMAVRDPQTPMLPPVTALVRDESFDSLVSSIATYAREEVLAHLESVTKLLTGVKESFEDEMDRQILFFEVKEHLGKLWEIDFPRNDYFLQAVSLLEDSLAYTKSEDLSKEQVEGLLEVVEICKRVDLSINDVRRCGRILRNRRIATVPTLS